MNESVIPTCCCVYVDCTLPLLVTAVARQYPSSSHSISQAHSIQLCGHCRVPCSPWCQWILLFRSESPCSSRAHHLGANHTCRHCANTNQSCIGWKAAAIRTGARCYSTQPSGVYSDSRGCWKPSQQQHAFGRQDQCCSVSSRPWHPCGHLDPTWLCCTSRKHCHDFKLISVTNQQ